MTNPSPTASEERALSIAEQAVSSILKRYVLMGRVTRGDLLIAAEEGARLAFAAQPASGAGVREANYTPYKSIADCDTAAIRAVRLLEDAEDFHANCDECEGEGVPELCAECFPYFDAARVERRLVMQSMAALATAEVEPVADGASPLPPLRPDQTKWLYAAAEFLDHCAGVELEFEEREHSALAIVERLHEAFFDDETGLCFHEEVAAALGMTLPRSDREG